MNGGDAPVTVAAAQPDDVDDLARLFDAYRVFYERSSDRESARAFVAARLREPVTLFFLARAGGVAAGFAHLLPSFDTLGMRPAWILEDLFVEPMQRKSGVGSALLRHVESFARASGAARVSLTTAHANHTAQRLYVANGYRHDEIFRGYYLRLT
jgi:ribosomal protein S18 acetylase RimI-like enzyme